MGNRFLDGLKLWLLGKVHVILESDEDWQFEVAGSDVEPYITEWNGEAWRCCCPDYSYRAGFSDGSFLCKHIFASIFEMFTVTLKRAALITVSEAIERLKLNLNGGDKNDGN